MKRFSVNILGKFVGIICGSILLMISLRHWANSTNITIKRIWIHKSNASYNNCCSNLWWPGNENGLAPPVSLENISKSIDCVDVATQKSQKAWLKNACNKFKRRIHALSRVVAQPVRHPVKNNLTGRFQVIDFTLGYVVSAYLDKRLKPPKVAIFLISIDRAERLYCQAWCDQCYTNVVGTLTRLSSFTEVSDNCIWQQYLLHCTFPKRCNVEIVSVTSSPCVQPTNSLNVNVIENNLIPVQPYQLDVCLNTLVSKTSADIVNIIRFMEGFRQIGGNLIHMYGYDENSEQVHEVMEYYQSLGLLKYHKWSIPPEVTSVYYFGEALQNNDCLYRNMNNSGHIIFMDMDDMFFPLEMNSHLNIWDIKTSLSVSRMKTNYFSANADIVHYCYHPLGRPISVPYQTLTVGGRTLLTTVQSKYTFPKLSSFTGVIFHTVKEECNISWENPESFLTQEFNNALNQKRYLIQTRVNDIVKELKQFDLSYNPEYTL